MTNEQIGEVVMAIGKKPLECRNANQGWRLSVYEHAEDIPQLLMLITCNGYEFRVKPDKPPQPTPTQVPGYKVVDFRPPLKGEKFWSKCRHGNGAISNCADENDPPNEPRYILAKAEPRFKVGDWVSGIRKGDRHIFPDGSMWECIKETT